MTTPLAKHPEAPAVIANRTPDSAGPSSHTTEPATHVDNLSERKSKLVAELRYLQAIEDRKVAGATILTPKGRLLDTRPFDDANPEKVAKWVNIATPGKADDRIRDGWTRVSQEDAEKVGMRTALGNDFVLMSKSRSERDKRVAEIAEINRSRMESQRADMAQVAESVARDLRDNHHIRVDAKRLFEER